LNRKLPEIADTIISEYLKLFDKLLPEVMEGFYVYGSAATGDFRSERSDIDFIAIVKNGLTYEQIDKLQLIHSSIQLKYKKPELNGFYITTDQLGLPKGKIKPVTYFYEGKVHDRGHFELNLVTWYQLKNSAITIRGASANELGFTVNWNDLIAEMKNNMNTYWKEWIRKSSRLFSRDFILLLSPERVEWGVLGVARQFYSFSEGGIVSKTDAGKWALTKVPEKYYKILQEALNIRSGGKRTYSSRFRRRKDTLEFMNYILSVSDIASYRD
jgi:predicted nucleotidyltransferase